MKKQRLIFLHILYWSLFIINEMLVPYFIFKESVGIFSFTFLLISALCFYFNYFWVVPRFFDISRLNKILLGYIISVVFFVIVRFVLEQIIFPKIFGVRNYAEGTGLGFYFYDNLYFSFVTIFVSTVYSLFRLFSKSENEKIRLISEKKNAELQALKMQINPHFIFNSLNNIYSLVYQKSDKSLSAIEELSRLLRYSTKDLEKDFIPLEKEIGYLESLISLEKLRIKNPELISVEKNISFLNLNISPMLLVPFVENVFKHGNFTEKGFALKVSDNKKILHFYLHNFKNRKSKDLASGIGIENVKKRLEILYPKKHQLNIAETETEFTVDLKIDLKNEEN